MSGELDPYIKANVSGPKKAAGDGQSMEQHPIPDQIAADKYFCNKGALSGGKGSLFRKMVARLSPPGAI